jgi:cAMP-dependent protein kinase regulator
MSKTTLNRLRDLDLFEGCTRSQLAKIDRLGIALQFPPGRALCVEGSPGAEFFLLIDGVVDARTSSGTVALLHSGSWFGETALIDNAPRRATVTARSQTMLIVFGRREFATLLAIAPKVRARLQRTAAFYAGDPGARQVPPFAVDPNAAPFHAAAC